MTVAVVSFSTGVGSGEVAYRCAEQYDRVVLVSADTLVEDEDNWRYAVDVWRDLGRPEWWRIVDGRHPMEVGRDQKCVPNNRMAVCSDWLKRRAIRRFVTGKWEVDEIVIAVGIDWSEEHRLAPIAAGWAPYEIVAPLTDPPLLMKHDLLDGSRRRGIEPPRLYAAGFPHANCGGGCVRAGQVEWRRLLFWNRERYLWWETEEETSRAMLGKDVAILRHRSGPRKGSALSLREFREQIEGNASLFARDDYGACGCFMEEPPEDDDEDRPVRLWLRNEGSWDLVDAA